LALHLFCPSAAVFALAFRHQQDMKTTNWLLFLCLFLAGLSKAISGKSSSSKKRPFEGDESSSSEDWASFSLGMHAQNLVPGTLAKKMVEKAEKAGAVGVKLRGKKGKNQNNARTLMRAYPKTAWPSLYWCQIPMKNKKTNTMMMVWHCFQLPHEWLGKYMASPGAIQLCQPKTGSKCWASMQHICKKLGLTIAENAWPEQGLFPFGVHGDGVPVQGTIRKQGLDYFTVNLPCCPINNFRVPFTAIQSKYHWEYKTKEAIWNVFMWSMDCLKKGQYPSCRHDGSKWIRSDNKRKGLKGALPGKGILAEVRGDWDWLNSWCNIPTYNTKTGLCWLCCATHANYKGFGPEERAAKLDKDIFVSRVLEMKKDLCPLWGLPEMAPANLILPDWLHAVDQGCGADMVGQILVELAECYPGRSFKLRIDALWEDIQMLYKEYDIEYKLTNLCPEILNKGKGSTGPPTLKCQAAVMRHLVQILPLLTAKHFSGGSKHQQACHKLARFLTESYTAMETNDLDNMSKWGARVSGQYMALEREALAAGDSVSWHIMPKLHQYQHLTECGFAPKDFWCYKDETTGGELARLFTRRGGKDNPGKNCAQLLLRWQQCHQFPSLET